MGITISLSNLKGGVGKTSSCHHLGGVLSRMGWRVLLVDNDPQASLTQGFWGPATTKGIDKAASVAAMYDADLAPIPEAIIRPTGFEGLAIIPGSRHLTAYNMTPVGEWAGSERGMREFLGEVRDDYDVTLIDNPPNLHLCTRAALVASDFVVSPVQAEDYGAQGLEPVQEAIADVQAGPNPGLSVAGLLITMYDKRLGIHLAYEAMLRETYGADVFAATFPLAKDFKEAVASRQPISHYKPKSAAAKAVIVVADELLRRVGLETVVIERRVA
jgi:chromosome partitioning protein